MEHYKRLDQIIEELSSEAKSFQGVTRIVDEIGKLQTVTSEQSKKITSSEKKLSESVEWQLQLSGQLNQYNEQIKQAHKIFQNNITTIQTNLKVLLEEQVNKLKNSYSQNGEVINEAYDNFQKKIIVIQTDLKLLLEEQVVELTKSYSENRSFIESTLSEEFSKVKESQEKMALHLTDIISDNLEGYKQTFLENLSEDIKNVHVDINNYLEGIVKIIEDFQKQTSSQIKSEVDELSDSIRKFQRELDSSIFSRLDKHKSDIQVEIRNEGTQIQRALETTLNSNFNQMETKMKDAFERQTKQLNTLKILTFILIAVSIGLAVGLFAIK